MLKEGDEFSTWMHVRQIAENRTVKGGLIPEDSGYFWIFIKDGVKTELMLSPEAMQAVMEIYVLLLRDQQVQSE